MTGVETEKWKEVPGYGGRYQVSDLGRLVSTSTTVRKTLIVPDKNSKGYEMYRLYHAGKGKRFFAHRLVMLVFSGEPPSNLHQVNHRNGIKTDNRLANLEYVTPSENQMHSSRVLGKKKARYRPKTAWRSRLIRAINCNEVRSRFPEEVSSILKKLLG